MGPENGINLNEVNYFPIEEYAKKIRLTDILLEHMEDTNNEFDKYFKTLANYDENVIMNWLISITNSEMLSSQLIENKHFITPEQIKKGDIFFDKFQMSHTRIKNLHRFVTQGEVESEYRKTDVRVSRMLDTGEEQIFWKGANYKDLKLFMDDFINLYKKTSLSLLSTNPFLRSALMHLLFVRIHPFKDGNGRTARVIHNLCFTDSINKIYGMKLKISPLNLSRNILISKITYVNKINDIYFDLVHDSNDEINEWFDFILNMVDEQLFFCINKLNNLESEFYKVQNIEGINTKEEVKKMKIKKK